MGKYLSYGSSDGAPSCRQRTKGYCGSWFYTYGYVSGRLDKVGYEWKKVQSDCVF